MDHQKLLTDLPSDIIVTILYRLPPKTIISCKCVCKSLLQILETPDFVKFHLSKSIPGLIVYDENIPCNPFKLFEFKDELNLEEHELHYVPVTESGCMGFMNLYLSYMSVKGSANGLLFLRNLHALYICNPITREYINLPNLEMILIQSFSSNLQSGSVTWGFGVSKKTDQYKVVRIFQEFEVDQKTCSLLRILKSECRVYTLGTGTWRSIPHSCYLMYTNGSNGVFLNGYLHWLVSDLKRSLLISCFDLETELFKVFSPPPYLQGRRMCFFDVVAVLGDCLCLCDTTSENKTEIWVMKEYGVEKSWRKEIVIPDPLGESFDGVYPIKVFGDGDILLSCGRYNLAYYSNKTKTTLNVEMFKEQGYRHFDARLHVSSFLSLKSFAKENVAKF